MKAIYREDGKGKVHAVQREYLYLIGAPSDMYGRYPLCNSWLPFDSGLPFDPRDGWTTGEREITCKRCLKMLERQ